MNPFLTETQVGFNPLAPTLMSIDADQSDKLLTYYQHIMEGCVCDYMKKGSEGNILLQQLATVAVELHREVDFVLLDVMSSREHEEQLHCWQAILELLSGTCHLDVMDSGEHVMALNTAKQRNISGSLTLVANTMESVDWWRERLFQYITQLPSLQEYLPKMHEMSVELSALVGRQTTTEDVPKALELLKCAAKKMHEIKGAVKED
eukprot:6456975-Amphidinium_carterae.1